ncbi:flavin reductase family protein [Rhizobium alvei]|uniref:Flavin reductase family protein n=1 Tax=Rhizobium alvei TaxID=1132659 RepID=A0ABT8YK38_9HYPH|nr:flavin reductase family protein [Rhizobium alvei]MDO6964063.1 flavin reductase family protein [Rhizobium alvei]
MFYAAETRDHGLPHDPFKAIVAPRPIGWIGSKGRDGSFNLSPYSFFTVVSDRPKIIMFSSSGRKDSLQNAEETGVFTASLVSAPLIKQMNASSVAVPYGTDEFAIAGLTPVIGRMVDAPYVGEAFAALECRVTEIRQPLDVNGQPSGAWMVFGQVVGIHIDEQIIRDGRIDIAVAAPVTRLGYMDYATTTETYELFRPKAP